MILTALLKDAFREIKRSPGRFISVFVIIALGSGFFTGLKASKPDMIDNAAQYFEDSSLMDIQLRSNIGIKSSQIAAVRSAENVKGAYAGYSKDLYYIENDQSFVLKAISISSGIDPQSGNSLNKLYVKSGRLPEAKNECVVEVRSTAALQFEIGDAITLSPPSENEEISETLAYDTYEVVGIVVSPLYIGYERDYTTVGDGTVTMNIFLPEEAFVCDYYTDLFVSLDGLENLDPFSEEYENKVSEYGRSAIDAFNESVQERYDKLISDAESSIDSAQADIEFSEELLSADADGLTALYEKISNELENLRMRYESMDDGVQKSLVKSSVVQYQSRAESIAALISDTDGTVRSQYEALLSESKDELAAAVEELENTAQLKTYAYTRFDSNDYSSYKGDADKINNVSKVFPLFFIIIAALVCLTAMTRMVEEQRTQIGTYKAIGYSTRHILIKYLIYSLLAAVGGSCIGSYIGLKVIPGIVMSVYGIMYNIPYSLTPVRPGYILWAAAAAIAVVGFAVIFTCVNELRREPAFIMRPKPPAKGKRIALERVSFIWNRLSFLMKVTMRNLLRYKKRFLMTLVGVSGCTALIVTGFGIKYSVSSIADLQYGTVFSYSGTVSLNSDKTSPEAALDDCGDIESYLTVCSVSASAGTKDNLYSATIIAPENVRSLSDFISMKTPDGGDITLDGNGVVITDKLASMCSLSKGDEIYIKTNDGGEYTAVISDVMKNYALHFIYMSGEFYAELFGEEPQANIAFFNASEGSEDSEVKSSLIADERIMGVTYKSDSTKGFMDSMDSMDSIVLLLIVCAAFLAITVLYNLSSINITERRREIATIKVLGFYDGETSAYIYRENIISTLIGVAAGLLMSRALHYFVIITVEVEAVQFNRELIWWAYIFGAALTMVFAAIVNLTLHFRLKRIDMAESLGSIE